MLKGKSGEVVMWSVKSDKIGTTNSPPPEGLGVGITDA